VQRSLEREKGREGVREKEREQRRKITGARESPGDLYNRKEIERSQLRGP
jgi:hypothetical protein